MPTAETVQGELVINSNNLPPPKQKQNFLVVLFLLFILSALSLVYLLINPDFGGFLLSKVTLNKPAPATKFFAGNVVRIIPKDQKFILEVMDAEATSAASRLTKSFVIKEVPRASPSASMATESASRNSYFTEFGEIRIGDSLKVAYSGDKEPYKPIFVQDEREKDAPPRPAFMHGFVTVVSGDSLKMYSTDGGDYTLMIDGTVLLGPMYEKLGNQERPGKLKPVIDFSSLKVGQEVSVFYSRNFGEIIIPDSILTL